MYFNRLCCCCGVVVQFSSGVSVVLVCGSGFVVWWACCWFVCGWLLLGVCLLVARVFRVVFLLLVVLFCFGLSAVLLSSWRCSCVVVLVLLLLVVWLLVCFSCAVHVARVFVLLVLFGGRCVAPPLFCSWWLWCVHDPGFFARCFSF